MDEDHAIPGRGVARAPADRVSERTRRRKRLGLARGVADERHADDQPDGGDERGPTQTTVRGAKLAARMPEAKAAAATPR